MPTFRVSNVHILLGMVVLVFQSYLAHADVIFEFTEGAGNSVVLNISGDGILQFGRTANSFNDVLDNTTGFLRLDNNSSDDFDLAVVSVSGLYTLTQFSISPETTVPEFASSSVLFEGLSVGDVITTDGTLGFSLSNWEPNSSGSEVIEIFTEGHSNEWDGNSDFVFDTTFSTSSILGNYSDLTEGTYNFRTDGVAGKNLITFQVGTVLLGDVNQDGTVNLLDIEPFTDRLNTGTFQAEADCNEDGTINLLDIEPFIAILNGG